jgi:hypothetical protein
MKTCDAVPDHGHAPGTTKAAQATATLARVEEEDRKLKEAKKPAPAVPEAQRPPIDVKPVESPAAPGATMPTRHIEAEAIRPDLFRITGDLHDRMFIVERFCTCDDGFWYATPEKLKAMEEMQTQANFTLSVIPQKGAKPAKQTKPKPPAAEPELWTGVVKIATEKMTTGAAATETRKARASVPYLSVLFKRDDKKDIWLSVFDHEMFPHFFQAKAKECQCELFVKRQGDYANVVGLKKIGALEFEDGKVPVVQQRDREAGSLFNGSTQ